MTSIRPKRILVVEDSQFFASLIADRLGKEDDLSLTVAETLEEALYHVDNIDEFALALLDLNLPDAPNGEIVDAIAERCIPSIVFTTEATSGKRDQIYNKGVIDYVVKDSPSSIDYLSSMVRRVIRNLSTKVLLVDDSQTSRKLIGRLLKTFQLNALEAESGEEALEVLKQHPDTRLVITDCEMPGMNGFELIKRIRRDFDKRRLAIIGVSASGNSEMSARFIKLGANDFISKPFGVEEFLCRISQNLENLDLMESLHDAATRDYLTGLHNRRFFYDAAQPLLARAVRQSGNIAVMMFDIDHFKSVNDTYGHDAGDLVLKHVANALSERTRGTDIIARMGGEEFCVLLTDVDPVSLEAIARDYLDRIANLRIEISGDTTLRVTTSAGLNAVATDNLDTLISQADGLLYMAKESGRNCAFVRQDGKPEFAVSGPRDTLSKRSQSPAA